jgi:polynucleotide 5'-kinase involved in rRNA processing
MPADSATLVPEAAWNQILDQARGRTVMVIGGPGTGKSMLARSLAAKLADQAGPLALLSADMGQQHVGVPTCLGLALGEPWEQPAALWFIGDISPRGSLLPTVIGTAKLTQRARAEGAQTVVIDTTGLVEAPVGGVLKYHKALAAGAACVVAIQRDRELEPILGLLGGICPQVHRLAVPPGAKDRSAAERKAFRQQRYEAHFHDGRVVPFPTASLIPPDWAVRPDESRQYPPPGTVVGLLDQEGFCLGLGILEEVQPEWLAVYTPWKRVKAVVRVQAGKIRLDRLGAFCELPSSNL